MQETKRNHNERRSDRGISHSDDDENSPEENLNTAKTIFLPAFRQTSVILGIAMPTNSRRLDA
jgi:hypothetical protein